MKKLLLLSLALCLSYFSNAQKKAVIPSHLLNKSENTMETLNGDEIPLIINETNQYLKSKPSKDLGFEIGNTWYDLQSNGNNGNRMLVFPDGSINAVWTFNPTASTGTTYPDRGTGYNKSTNDGVSWLPNPSVRIEGTTTKTGWPNIGKLNNGSLVVASHGYSPTQGAFSKSTNSGTTWATSQLGGPTLGLVWPRMLTNGNTIHVIGQTATTTPYQGFDKGALVYLRSTDGGSTWSNPVIPTGIDVSNYLNTIGFNDKYSIACKGDTIAIVYGEGFRTPCLVKSTNNGTSWSYREILHLPIQKFNTEGTAIYDINGDSQQDNVYSTDGVNFVMLDSYGKAHVFFGRMKHTDDGAGAGSQYFPYTDGIYYWNEDMSTINYDYKWTNTNGTSTYEGIPDTVNFPIITEIVDLNNNGIIDLPDNGANIPFGYYGCSLSSHPNAVITPEGAITLFYSSIVEGTDGTVGSEHRAFRNIWEIHKLVGAPNFTWSIPTRIVEDDFTEEVFPCVSPVLTKTGNNYKAHLWYQADGFPGNALFPTGNPHPVSENIIYYVKYSLIPVNTDEINIAKTAPVVYPNPASDNVVIAYNLTDAANVSISIYNMVGQEIMTTNENVSVGEVNVNLNIETLPKGIYFIKSDIGAQSYINKLIVD